RTYSNVATSSCAGSIVTVPDSVGDPPLSQAIMPAMNASEASDCIRTIQRFILPSMKTLMLRHSAGGGTTHNPRVRNSTHAIVREHDHLHGHAFPDAGYSIVDRTASLRSPGAGMERARPYELRTSRKSVAE